MSFDNLNLDNLNAIDTQYKPENYKVQTSADEIFGDDYNAKSEENEIEVEKSSESLTVCNDPIYQQITIIITYIINNLDNKK